jgi:hypothetical protein
MKFMVQYSISQDQFFPLLKRWVSMSAQEQMNAGEGVSIIGRWHDVAARGGVVILEAGDLLAVQRYIGQWTPYLDCDIAPVLDDAELTAVGRQIIADNNA